MNEYKYNVVCVYKGLSSIKNTIFFSIIQVIPRLNTEKNLKE